MKNESEIEQILKELPSDKARSTFLQRAYKPGDEPVFELLKKEGNDYYTMQGIYQKEIEHYLQTGDLKKAKGRLSEYLDFMEKREAMHDINLGELLKKWAPLQDSLIEQLEDRKEYGLLVETLSEFDKEKAKTYLEKALNQAKIKKGFLKWEPDHRKQAHLYGCVGEHEKAIEQLLEDEAYDSAYALAKEHLPEKSKEIAEQGVEHFKKKLDNDKDWGLFYRRLIGFLAKLDRKEDIFNCVKEYWENCVEPKKKETYELKDNIEQMYFELRDIDAKLSSRPLEFIKVKIDKLIQNESNEEEQHYFVEMLSKAGLETKGILEVKLHYFEEHGDFSNALEMAEKIGDKEKTALYKRVIELTAHGG